MLTTCSQLEHHRHVINLLTMIPTRLTCSSAWYDQVLVLDAGRLVEHGSPLDLFDARGVFWSLCDEASVSREDIVRIRAAVLSSQ
jgi:ABC-type multidrug transport system fused ATPase/permease subunit